MLLIIQLVNPKGPATEEKKGNTCYMYGIPGYLAKHDVWNQLINQSVGQLVGWLAGRPASQSQENLIWHLLLKIIKQF
jgi:hypothetical protein